MLEHKHEVIIDALIKRSVADQYPRLIDGFQVECVVDAVRADAATGKQRHELGALLVRRVYERLLVEHERLGAEVALQEGARRPTRTKMMQCLKIH